MRRPLVLTRGRLYSRCIGVDPVSVSPRGRGRVRGIPARIPVPSAAAPGPALQPRLQRQGRPRPPRQRLLPLRSAGQARRRAPHRLLPRRGRAGRPAFRSARPAAGPAGAAVARPVAGHAPRTGPALRRPARRRGAPPGPPLGPAQRIAHATCPACWPSTAGSRTASTAQPAGDQSCSPLQVFDALVQYRNGVFGHGGPRFRLVLREGDGPAPLSRPSTSSWPRGRSTCSGRAAAGWST